MSRWWLLLASVLLGCSRGPAVDLPAIAEARSLDAEWALVNERAAKERLTGAFGMEIRALLAEPADAAPEELRATRAVGMRQARDLRYARSAAAIGKET